MSEPTDTRLAEITVKRSDLQIIKTLLVLLVAAAVAYGVYYVVDRSNQQQAQSIHQTERFGLEYCPPGEGC